MLLQVEEGVQHLHTMLQTVLQCSHCHTSLMMYAIWSSLSLRWCLASAAATSDTGPRPHSSMQYHTCRPTLDTGPCRYGICSLKTS